MQAQHEPSLPPPQQQRQRQRRNLDRERKRAARACDGCRRQKEKCDGGVPCRRCFRLKRKCEFSGRAPPRGTSDVGKSTAMAVCPTANCEPGREAVPEAMYSRVPSVPGQQDLSQRVAYLEKIIQHYAGDVTLDAVTVRNMADGADRQRRPMMETEVSVNGSDIASVDAEDFSIQPLENNITHYSGEFSHWNFSMRIKQWIDQTVLRDDTNQTPDSTVFKEYYRPEELQSPSSIVNSISSLPPRSIANFLVHSFFNHAEANYFFVERQWLEDRLDTVYERPATLSRRDVGSVCVIFAILAIGAQYAYLESYAEGHEDHPPYGLKTKVSEPFSEDNVSVMFYQQACRLLTDVIAISSLESVQACLLIGIYTLPLDASGLSYIYLNLALKLAIQNGMHRKCPVDSLNDSLRETRNRVWWTAYTIERRVGIFHGRPISISASDLDADLPVDRSINLWPSTTAIHTAHFLATLHLNQILSKMSHEISLLKNHTVREISNGLGRLIELRRGLVTWWDGLPDTLFAKATPAMNALQRSATTRTGVHLNLEYCLVRIFVGRAFIFSRSKSQISSPVSQHQPDNTTAAATAGVGAGANNNTTASPSQASTSNSDSRALLVADCIDASLTVVDLCRHLRNTIGLARASYTEFSACRAALLVIITQCLQRKTDRFRRALRSGLAMLKEMSAGCESARSELSLIEAFDRAIARLDVSSTASVAESRAGSEYAQFKRWEQSWKSDAVSLSSSAAVDRMGEGSMQHMSMPMASQQAAGPSASSWMLSDGPLQRQIPGPMPTETPLFDVDGNFASFPQTIDEFSSLLAYRFGNDLDYLQTGNHSSI
ncbi:hypothetical protein BU24DRAFT_129249 [Aaosphaeria arxii CBS 175.79]|uniref:Zn(2)-C6 fungal-type domain-containing protein n=1 Tax=Aaosphaeria arxii CBS 175.79 TaxID=1450172 RepID=A0A6A5Y5T5_9PLEO|nr:uncharacterized protein BU24DRAFT_129249 [Aaosphaeria arxii CBS 175.79]KAF2019914.1 hypothetical protein BU24DRAFT_129249 [Aaosphaeria arxii CBS 175.79]